MDDKDKELDEILAEVKRDYLTEQPPQHRQAPRSTPQPSQHPQTQQQAQRRPLTPQERKRHAEARRKAKRKKRILRSLLVGMIALLVILTTILIVAITHSDDGLKGTWHADESTVYEFDGKGSGAMHTSLSDYPFTYEVKGGTLSIDFESEAARDTVYQYSIKGKTLTLTREDGTYTLTKD